MKLLQLLVEMLINGISMYLPKKKPSDLAYHIAWFNKQGWAARLQANGQIEPYIYHPYTKV
jgi:hypothetical protein